MAGSHGRTLGIPVVASLLGPPHSRLSDYPLRLRLPSGGMPGGLLLRYFVIPVPIIRQRHRIRTMFWGWSMGLTFASFVML